MRPGLAPAGERNTFLGGSHCDPSKAAFLGGNQRKRKRAFGQNLQNEQNGIRYSVERGAFVVQVRNEEKPFALLSG
jgi:hypothetical protein